MARRRHAPAVDSQRVEYVLKAIAVTLVLMLLVGIAAFLFTARKVDSGAPRSAVEYRLRASQEAIDADPGSAEGWYQLGAAQSDAGMYRRAIDSLTRVTDADPENEEAWFELGLAHQRSGDEGRAIEAYEEAVKWAQDSVTKRIAELESMGITEPLFMPDAGARACVALAELYVDAGDYDRAREIANVVVADNPMDASAQLALARVEEAAGNTEAATDAYRKAQEYLPDDPAIAEALERLGAQ